MAADIIGAVSRLKITKYHVLGFTRPNSQYDSFVDDNDGHFEYIFSEGRNYLRKWKQSNMANLQEEMYRHIKDSIPEEK